MASGSSLEMSLFTPREMYKVQLLDGAYFLNPTLKVETCLLLLKVVTEILLPDN